MRILLEAVFILLILTVWYLVLTKFTNKKGKK